MNFFLLKQNIFDLYDKFKTNLIKGIYINLFTGVIIIESNSTVDELLKEMNIEKLDTEQLPSFFTKLDIKFFHL